MTRPQSTVGTELDRVHAALKDVWERGLPPHENPRSAVRSATREQLEFVAFRHGFPSAYLLERVDDERWGVTWLSGTGQFLIARRIQP